MAVTTAELQEILSNNFPDSEINIHDSMGSGDSYAIQIISERFQGLNRVKQHKLVMDCLREVLAERLHAVTLKTSCKA